MSKDHDFFKEIHQLIKQTTYTLKTAGLNKKSIDMAMEGQQVLNCPNCNTLNLFEVELDRYKCNACKQICIKIDKDTYEKETI